MANSNEPFVDKQFPEDVTSLAKTNPKDFGDLLGVPTKNISWKKPAKIFKNFTVFPEKGDIRSESISGGRMNHFYLQSALGLLSINPNFIQSMF